MSMHEKEKWGREGAGLDWVGLSWDQMASASERASELGLESHSSTAIPIVN